MGKIGDLSGIEGKIGDLSGDSTFQDIRAVLLQDRDADKLECLELRVRRLQNEMLAITAWLDARITALEEGATSLLDNINLHASRLTSFDDLNIDARLKALEQSAPPNGGKV